MRARVNLIIEEYILAKIDAIAGEKNKRAAVIEKALLEFITREEAKEAANPKPQIISQKIAPRNKPARV